MRKTRPWFMLLLALATGSVAATLALRYLRQQTTPLMAAEPRRANIVVAARPLQVGAFITEQDVKTIPWPGDALPPGVLTNTADAVGRGVITPVAENEPFLNAKLSTKEAGGGLPIVIRDGMRAVSVKVDEVVGVAGFVIPGTRTDVLVSIDDEITGAQPMTRTILQNVQTLAAGQTTQRDAEGKPITVSVVTVLVTPQEAELLTLATKHGRLQLALRNPLDTASVETPGARRNQLALVAPATAERPRVASRIRAPVAAPKVEHTVVEGYRGGERTLTTFQNQKPQ